MWAKFNEDKTVKIIINHNYTEEQLIEKQIFKYKEIEVNQRYYSTFGEIYIQEDAYIIGTKEKSPKNLGKLKAMLIKEIKEKANSLLKDTDWVATRKLEENIDIPESIANYRSNVRLISNQKEQEVSAIDSFDGILEFDEQVYIETHLVSKFIEDDMPMEYGPETKEIEVILSGVQDLWPDHPYDELSETFVSRIKS